MLAVIDGVLAAEEDAISTYESLVDAARDADDPVTEDVAVGLLGDEEAHRSEFRGFEKEYQRDERRFGSDYSIRRSRLVRSASMRCSSAS